MCQNILDMKEKNKLVENKKFNAQKSKGEIIVYMDDDDYYPPDRVNHAVDRLRARPKALASGSSIVYIYFNDLDKIYQFGPYGPNRYNKWYFCF